MAGLLCMAVVTRQNTLPMVDRQDVCNPTWIVQSIRTWSSMHKTEWSEDVGDVASASACLDYRDLCITNNHRPWYLRPRASSLLQLRMGICLACSIMFSSLKKKPWASSTILDLSILSRSQPRFNVLM